MIAIDASALLAIVLDEPERRSFSRFVFSHDYLAPTPTLLEAHLRLMHSNARAQIDILNFLVDRPNAEVIPFDQDHLIIAKSAFERFGRGSGHPAKLNYGDCMSYAIAMERGIPLLFKGEGFPHTDIEPAYIL